MMTCPRCQQDYLEKYVDIASRRVFISCPECDATWSGESRPSVSNFVDLEEFLGTNGIDWAKAQALGPL